MSTPPWEDTQVGRMHDHQVPLVDRLAEALRLTVEYANEQTPARDVGGGRWARLLPNEPAWLHHDALEAYQLEREVDPAPEPVELIRQAREALGLSTSASPDTPRAVWEDTLTRARELSESARAGHFSSEAGAFRDDEPLPGRFLTADEHECIRLLGAASNLFGRIVGDGPTRGHDLDELVSHVHVLQRTVGSQAAARAYPLSYRLLGATLRPDERTGEPGPPEPAVAVGEDRDVACPLPEYVGPSGAGGLEVLVVWRCGRRTLMHGAPNPRAFAALHARAEVGGDLPCPDLPPPLARAAMDDHSRCQDTHERTELDNGGVRFTWPCGTFAEPDALRDAYGGTTREFSYEFLGGMHDASRSRVRMVDLSRPEPEPVWPNLERMLADHEAEVAWPSDEARAALLIDDEPEDDQVVKRFGKPASMVYTDMLNDDGLRIPPGSVVVSMGRSPGPTVTGAVDEAVADHDRKHAEIWQNADARREIFQRSDTAGHEWEALLASTPRPDPVKPWLAHLENDAELGRRRIERASAIALVVFVVAVLAVVGGAWWFG